MKKTFARMEVKADKGLSALSHAKYIMGLGGYQHKQDEIQCVAMGNMPDWAIADPLKFWRASDENERSNGNKYREHVINLPRELTPEQRQEVIEAWIEQELGDRHAYTYAIHVPNATDGKAQPHCHLMFSDRIADGVPRNSVQYFKRYNVKDPSKGGCRKNNPPSKSNERKKHLQEQKDRMQDLLNAKLLEYGHDVEVDMLSSRASRGLIGDAEPHMSRAMYHHTKRIEEMYPDLVEMPNVNKKNNTPTPPKSLKEQIMQEKTEQQKAHALTFYDGVIKDFCQKRDFINEMYGSKMPDENGIQIMQDSIYILATLHEHMDNKPKPDEIIADSLVTLYDSFNKPDRVALVDMLSNETAKDQRNVAQAVITTELLQSLMDCQGIDAPNAFVARFNERKKELSQNNPYLNAYYGRDVVNEDTQEAKPKPQYTAPKPW